MLIGRSEKARGSDPVRIKASAIAFLHVAELYGSVSKPMTAEALYLAGEGLSKLKESDPEKARTLRALARRILTKCTSEYSTTPWARKAKSVLAQM